VKDVSAMRSAADRMTDAGRREEALVAEINRFCQAP
jgi:hypothetical protein